MPSPIPRIRFHNLPANTGHQSTPHNTGVERARGEFVFFLNQDDMYFPDHVSKRLAFMRATGADVSWSPILLLQQSGLETGSIHVDKDVLMLDGTVADGRFDPETFVISSCWAVRREICAKVGVLAATARDAALAFPGMALSCPSSGPSPSLSSLRVGPLHTFRASSLFIRQRAFIRTRARLELDRRRRQ